MVAKPDNGVESNLTVSGVPCNPVVRNGDNVKWSVGVKDKRVVVRNAMPTCDTLSSYHVRLRLLTCTLCVYDLNLRTMYRYTWCCVH